MFRFPGTRCTQLPTSARERLVEMFCRGGDLPPNIDLHHFIRGDAVIALVVELGGAGRCMCRHLARLPECPTVFEVSRDAGTAMPGADFGGDARGLGAASRHLPGVVRCSRVELRLPG